VNLPFDSQWDLLATYLEGGLEPRARAEVEAWLESDGDARRELALLEELLGDLDAVAHALRHWADAVDAAPSLSGILDKANQKPVAAFPMSNGADEKENPLAQLFSLRDALDEAGAEFRQHTPEVDLTESVMGHVAALRAEAASPLPSEMEALLNAFMEENLSQEDATALEDACESTAAVREAYLACEQLQGDLEALATSWAADLPEVDMVSTVSSAMASPPASGRRRPSRSGSGAPAPALWARIPWISMGIAACIVVILGLLVSPLLGPENKLNPIGIAENDPSLDPNTDPVPVTPMNDPAPVAPMNDTAPPETSPAAEGENAPLSELWLVHVMAEYRLAQDGDLEALDRFTQWASLSAADARMLLANPESPLDARIGASRALPPEEALAVLREALQREGEDPHMRFLAAEYEAEIDASSEEHLANLRAWSDADPENAMPVYMEGRALLGGDAPEQREAALSALARAAELPDATAYPVTEAQRREAALHELGAPEESADFLAASALGIESYASATALGDELIDYGEHFASEGDFLTAEQVYGAVLELGGKLVVSALAANEYLAGVDMQKKAIVSLSELYAEQGPGLMAPLLEERESALPSQEALLELFLSSYEESFATAEEAYLADLTALILQQGDLQVFTENAQP
jgi:hypothetical protein